MTNAATRLRILRQCLAPILALASDMGEITGSDEVFNVMAAVGVRPTTSMADYALGNSKDKNRFRRIAA